MARTRSRARERRNEGVKVDAPWVCVWGLNPERMFTHTLGNGGNDGGAPVTFVTATLNQCNRQRVRNGNSGNGGNTGSWRVWMDCEPTAVANRRWQGAATQILTLELFQLG